MAKAAAKAAARKDDREAFAARPETTGKVKVASPQTSADYLASLRDGREVYIYGERVKDVTTHQAFRNTARMVARGKCCAMYSVSEPQPQPSSRMRWPSARPARSQVIASADSSASARVSTPGPQ